MESGYLRNGCGLIAEERVRQQQTLGYEPEGDDHYTREELREAAMSHLAICDDGNDDDYVLRHCWPWDVTFWKRGDDNKVRHLVKAGALVAAEIDRHHRSFQNACNEFASKELGFEIFDERDDYDLARLDWIGEDPEAFVRKHFEEDFCRLDYERDQARQSEEGGGADVQE